MKFHWEEGNKKGEFTVTAQTVQECVDIAKEEIENGGAKMIDWYSI